MQNVARIIGAKESPQEIQAMLSTLEPRPWRRAGETFGSIRAKDTDGDNELDPIDFYTCLVNGMRIRMEEEDRLQREQADSMREHMESMARSGQRCLERRRGAQRWCLERRRGAQRRFENPVWEPHVKAMMDLLREEASRLRLHQVRKSLRSAPVAGDQSRDNEVGRSGSGVDRVGDRQSLEDRAALSLG
eukprot:g16203.t1